MQENTATRHVRISPGYHQKIKYYSALHGTTIRVVMDELLRYCFQNEIIELDAYLKALGEDSE